jgi:hypothetical protein
MADAAPAERPKVRLSVEVVDGPAIARAAATVDESAWLAFLREAAPAEGLQRAVARRFVPDALRAIEAAEGPRVAIVATAMG